MFFGLHEDKKMVDVLNPNQRRHCMTSIRTRNTDIELQVRRVLHARGFRFRVHRRNLAGKPDIVLPRYQQVVFVHGCFWHGHHCTRGKLPKTNAEFWAQKISATKARDKRAVAALEAGGWNVSVIWECELEEGLSRLLKRLSSHRSSTPPKKIN